MDIMINKGCQSEQILENGIAEQICELNLLNDALWTMNKKKNKLFVKSFVCVLCRRPRSSLLYLSKFGAHFGRALSSRPYSNISRFLPLEMADSSAAFLLGSLIAFFCSPFYLAPLRRCQHEVSTGLWSCCDAFCGIYKSGDFHSNWMRLDGRIIDIKTGWRSETSTIYKVGPFDLFWFDLLILLIATFIRASDDDTLNRPRLYSVHCWVGIGVTKIKIIFFANFYFSILSEMSINWQLNILCVCWCYFIFRVIPQIEPHKRRNKVLLNHCCSISHLHVLTLKKCFFYR